MEKGLLTTSNEGYYNMYVYTRPWVNKITFVFGI